MLYTIALLITAGDELIAVNGMPVAGLSSAEMTDLLQHLAANEGLRITARRHVMQRINR